MFGFLSPLRASVAWRQAYARVCQYQRRMFGLTALPFLSYEATFLYQLCCDCGLVPILPDTAPVCCRLRRLSKSPQPDQLVGSFAAAFGMLLAGIKLQDDVRDSGRLRNRLLLWKYGRQISSALQTLAQFSPGIPERIAAILNSQSELERCRSSVTLSSATVPTGDGFGLLFRTLAECLSARSPDNSLTDRVPWTTSFAEHFEEIGRHVGRAIIAWDCAVDFDHDQLQQTFTPLTCHQDVEEAFDMCRLELCLAGALCPASSASAGVLDSVITKVEFRQQESERICRPQQLERWGLMRQRGYSYARCDGCEALCAVGECADCFASSGSLASCVEPSCCECIVCWPHTPCDGPCCSESRPAKTASGATGEKEVPPERFSSFVGREGQTIGALTPVGYILIDGEKLPACSDTGQYIVAEQRVMVTAADQFTVRVR